MSTVCSLCNLHCNILDIPVAWDSRHACSTCIPTIASAYMMHFFYVQQADPASKFFVFEAQGTRAVRRFKSLAEVAWSQSLKDLEWFNQNEVACMLHMYSTYYMMHNWIIMKYHTKMWDTNVPISAQICRAKIHEVSVCWQLWPSVFGSWGEVAQKGGQSLSGQTACVNRGRNWASDQLPVLQLSLAF